MKKQLGALSLATLLLLTACGNDTDSPGQNKEPVTSKEAAKQEANVTDPGDTNESAESSDPAEAKQKGLTRYQKPIAVDAVTLGKVQEEGTYFLDIVIPQLRGMANERMMNDYNALVEQHGKALINEVERREEELQGEEQAELGPHAGASLAYEVKSDTDNWFSLLQTGFLYSGGANGQDFKETFVYSKVDNIHLDLMDLFEETYDEQVMLKLLNEAMIHPEHGNLLFEPITKIPNEQKFYLTEDSVVLVYDKYEVTPGAAGAPEAVIAKSDLPFLKKMYK